MIRGWRFPLPRGCPFCDTPVRSLPWAPVWKRICPHCCDGFSPIAPPYCRRCGRAGREGICPDCRSHPYPELIQNCSAVSYTPHTREVIRLYKYLGRERFARPMGEMMVSVAACRVRKPDVISYVPLHPSRLVERGFNQSEQLARFIGKKWGVPVVSLLVRSSPTRPQSQRSRAERLQSMEGVFELHPSIPVGKLVAVNILLVDDVYTTGATLGACARVLVQAGCNSVRSLTFAR
ncbi:ComF family protein [Polycladomyces abyssicola]|uniref:ComF family protein n=1 Tax=Polycladomyces abyssicola TaxID=1125966 RepID=UPI001BB2E21A|nr:ComF family protein [Polycladomyces abyssicola]